MKLLLLGHLCIDRVHGAADTAVDRFGGIAGPLEALAALAAPEDTILPVCGVGESDEARFRSWLETMRTVDPSGVYAFPGATHTIDIYERPGGTRVACARDIAAPVPFERIRKFLAADGILINMASGSDITLDTLDQTRLEIRARGTPVHLDYHNLTTDVGPDRERVRRPLAEWRRWAFMLASVQLNEEEAAGLTPDGLSEGELVGHFLTLGTGAVVITRGAAGASVWVSEHKKIVRHDAAASAPGGDFPDARGAGDAFGAAFLYRTAAAADPFAAADFAAQRAGDFLRARRGRRS